MGRDLEAEGKNLYGEGPYWKAQLAFALKMRVDSIDNMVKGKSRVPPGVWAAIDKLRLEQHIKLAALRAELVRH